MKAVALIITLIALPSLAGKLDAFERDVNKPAPPKEQPQDRNDHEEPDALDDFWGQLFILPFWYGGSESLVRIDPGLSGLDSDLPPREPGEALIPFVRADLDWQHIEDGLTAWNVGGEVGYGPLGLRAGRLRFTEELDDGTEDQLDLTTLLGLYRMSFAACIEIDLGAGALWIDGDQETSSAAFTAGLAVHPHPDYGFEFRPLWADNLSIYDLGLCAGVDYIGLKAGWRWTESPEESLNGPYIGATLRY